MLLFGTTALEKAFACRGPLASLDAWTGVLAFERMLRAVFKDAAWTQSTAAQLAMGLGTFAVVRFARVFFRASDFATASRLVQAMVGALPRGDAILATRELLQVGLVTAGLLTAHWRLRNTPIEAVVARMPHALGDFG